MLGTIGFILVGVILSGAILAFWNDIRIWLNNTAADVVQKYIGYDARKAMQKAVSRADRIVNKIRNRSTVYYKKNKLDTYYDKITLEVTAPVYEFDEDVLKEIEKKGAITQEMKFKG